MKSKLNQPTHVSIPKIKGATVQTYAHYPLPAHLRMRRSELFVPSDYAKLGQNDNFEVRDDRYSNEFFNLPIDEFKKPYSVQYTWDGIGLVLAVDLGSTAYLRLSDIASRSRHSLKTLHKNIDGRHFASPNLCGADGTVIEFVEWSAAAPFCMATPQGRLLIALVHQVILGGLLGHPEDEIVSLNARVLHEFVPDGLEFPQWKLSLLGRYPELCQVAGSSSTGSFDIPLEIARRFAVESRSISGILAYIFVREAEPTSSHIVRRGGIPLFYRVQPFYQDRIGARALHLFLRSEDPFDSWIFEMIDNLGLVGGLDYFTTPALNVAHGPITADAIVGAKELFLTIGAAVRMGMKTPTARGRLMIDYRNEVTGEQPAGD